MKAKHLFHVLSTKPQDQKKGGTRTTIDGSNFKVLQDMALLRLVLHEKGVREPHWHPNADELGYCLRGDAMLTIVGNKGNKQTFCISTGDAYYVPSGFFHHIENIGKEECECILAFSDAYPQEFGISASLGCMKDAVLADTWGLKAQHFSKLKRSVKNTVIGQKKSKTQVPEYAHLKCPYKYCLEASNPILEKGEGSVRVARKNVWPILENLALYSLYLSDNAMREPHWHPLTAEMGYVNQGHARMTVLSPNGEVDTYKLKKGDLYFIPKGFPHHIENIGKEEVHFLIFFDQSTPGGIGYSFGTRAYSNEVLGATFQTSPAFFKKLPELYEDRILVPRMNPIDR